MPSSLSLFVVIDGPMGGGIREISSSNAMANDEIC